MEISFGLEMSFRWTFCSGKDDNLNYESLNILFYNNFIDIINLDMCHFRSNDKKFKSKTNIV